MKEVIVPADDLVCIGKDKLQEVIRCKDCYWYGPDVLKQDGTIDKRHKPTWCYLLREETKPMDYCSRAERRDE